MWCFSDGDNFFDYATLSHLFGGVVMSKFVDRYIIQSLQKYIDVLKLIVLYRFKQMILYNIQIA